MIPYIDEKITGYMRYQLLRYHIQTGDSIEWTGTSPVAHAIRWRTGMPVNHSSLAFRYILDGDTEPRISISEAVEGGVEPRFLSSVLDGYKGKVYLVRCLSDPADRLKLAKAALRFEGGEGQKKVRYDYLSLVSLLFRPRVPLNGSFLYCSEMIQQAAVDAGIIPASMNDGKGVVPGELNRLGIYAQERIRIY